MTDRCARRFPEWCSLAVVARDAPKDHERERLDHERDALLKVVHRRRVDGEAPTEMLEGLDEAHARNVRMHGAARAEYARFASLMLRAMHLRAWHAKRKDAAMLEAVEALERAKDAEEGEARWLRVGVWLARRVDEAAARVARRTKLMTRIDFSPAPSRVEYGEELEADDLRTIEEEDEIQW